MLTPCLASGAVTLTIEYGSGALKPSDTQLCVTRETETSSPYEAAHRSWQPKLLAGLTHTRALTQAHVPTLCRLSLL